MIITTNFTATTSKTGGRIMATAMEPSMPGAFISLSMSVEHPAYVENCDLREKHRHVASTLASLLKGDWCDPISYNPTRDGWGFYYE